MRRRTVLSLPLAIATSAATYARAAGMKNDPGVSDTEIRIGQTMPYSGPASAFGTQGRTAMAFYKMINAQGGINGRTITLLSLDDGYSPPKTVEQTRRLVEQEQVLAMVGTIGTPTNASVQRYLNDRKVPQLFIYSGVARFRDPRTSPWTLGVDLSFANQSRAFARYILEAAPNGKIGVLYQNDDYGKDNLSGLKTGLADRVGMIVKEASYDVTDPTVDSQIVSLRSSGADVLFDVGIPKFTAQAIRKAYDIGWKPLHIIMFPAASIPATLEPAGLDKSIGVITAEFLKQSGDATWKDDPEMGAYLAFIEKYNSAADPNDKFNVLGYFGAAAFVQMLKQCGSNVTRENLMRQATNMQAVKIPMLLPGITMNTTPEDYNAVTQMQLQRFDGRRWVAFGGIVKG